MSRAAGALARLAEIDPAPDASIHPRPAGSLANVFSLYGPQTSLPLGRRLDVLDGLRRRAPACGVAVAAGDPAHPPRSRPVPRRTTRGGRSWALVQPETITYAELFDGISKIVTRIIADAGKDPGRWHDLV